MIFNEVAPWPSPSLRTCILSPLLLVSPASAAVEGGTSKELTFLKPTALV